jgi:hypothetical protein
MPAAKTLLGLVLRAAAMAVLAGMLMGPVVGRPSAELFWVSTTADHYIGDAGENGG